MKILIVGGAGFIGINAVYSFLQKGYQVEIIDNLSRKGSEYNLNRLQEKYKVPFENIDIREADKLKKYFERNDGYDAVILLAGQVAWGALLVGIGASIFGAVLRRHQVQGG